MPVGRRGERRPLPSLPSTRRRRPGGSRWRGQIADEPETLLILKTTAARVDALAARLCELHPYEQPELLSVTPDRGLKGYLDWLEAAAGDSASS